MIPSSRCTTGILQCALVALAVLLFETSGHAQPAPGAEAEQPARPSLAGTLPAPEFPEGLDWFNVGGPLTLADLRGKVVLLDFWTYGCINCMHIIPDLTRLEEIYAEELVVIGVHSAKFSNEADSDNIRNIVLRYGREHPVVNDRDFLVWRRYGARAWPTLVLIDPLGNVVGFHEGEGIFDLFNEVIGALIEEFDARGLVDREPLAFVPDRAGPETPLRFPGKVLADTVGGRLFVADSGHDRIVVTDLEGRVLEVIGEGTAGLRDGTFADARFSDPQGMTLLDRDTLYVADTGNHALRRVDLAAGRVDTAVGTGQQTYLRLSESGAGGQGLNSPWDVLAVDGRIFIAMAGQHQLWVYDPVPDRLLHFAGSGREELRDGPLAVAGLNQPSGLASDGRVLFVADSEASAIRTASLEPDGSLETLVGTGLFDFGDEDGQGAEVRLQHPLGVAYGGGRLLLADTYNHKIKELRVDAREVTTLFGGDGSGWADGPAGEARFYEPGGLSLAGDVLYVADTNNHVIRRIDLATSQVGTLDLSDPLGLLLPGSEAWGGPVVRLEPLRVAPGERNLTLDLVLPPEHLLNDLAPLTLTWTVSGEAVTFEEPSFSALEPDLPLVFGATFSPGESLLGGELTVYYCRYDAVQLCLIEGVLLEVPVIVEDGGALDPTLSYQIADPFARP